MHHRILAAHLHNGRLHIIGVGIFGRQHALTAKYLPARIASLLQHGLHLLKAVAVNQRAHQIALQGVADGHRLIGLFQFFQHFGLHRFVRNQAAQAGATLPGSAHGGKQNTAHGQIQIGTGRQNHGVVAAQFQNTFAKALGHFGRHDFAHASAAGGADQWHTRIAHQLVANGRIAHQYLRQMRRCVGTELLHRLLKQRLAGQCGERGFFRRLPNHRIAAHQRQRGIPRPHRHRKIKRRNHPHHAQRMPAFAHMVAGTLRSDGEAVELARQAHGKIANINHFLHFAQAFLGNFARFPRHQLTQCLLVFAQNIAQQAHQLATARRRHIAPLRKRLLRLRYLHIHIGRAVLRHFAQQAAVNRRMHRQGAVLVLRGRYAHLAHQCLNHLFTPACKKPCYSQASRRCMAKIVRRAAGLLQTNKTKWVIPFFLAG